MIIRRHGANHRDTEMSKELEKKNSLRVFLRVLRISVASSSCPDEVRMITFH